MPGDVPTGYFLVRSPMYNGYAIFRATPQSHSKEDVDKALALVK